MFNKQFHLLLVASLALALLFTVTFAGLAQAQKTIKFAHVDPPQWQTSKKQAMVEVIKNYVESHTDNLKVEIYPGGQLGDETQIVKGVISGSIEMGTLSGPMASFFPPAMVLSTTYIFPNQAVAHKVLDGPFGDKLSEALHEKLGIYNLAFGETGFRHFTNSKRPIHTPEDLKGLKIRVMKTPIYVKLVKALGGSPTPVAWTECYSALKGGVVAGEENPISTIKYAKFYEVQDYVTLDGHTYSADWVLVNGKFFDNLSPKNQKVLKTAAKLGADAGRVIQEINSLKGVQDLREKGMKIYAPTKEELAKFQKKAQPPVIEWLKGKIDPHWISDLQGAVERATE